MKNEELKQSFEELYDLCKKSYENSLKKPELFGDIVGYEKRTLEIAEKLLKRVSAKTKKMTKPMWTKETCCEEAKKYKSRSEFCKGCCSAYKASMKNGWIDDYIWFSTKKKPNSYWTYERCFEEALKYKSRSDFYRGNQSAYSVSKKRGFIDKFIWFDKKRKPKDYWTLEHCCEEAKKYKSKSDFAKKSSAAYHVAVAHKWIDDLFPPTT